MVSEYRDVVRKGREQFRKEIESIVPDIKLGKAQGKNLYGNLKLMKIIDCRESILRIIMYLLFMHDSWYCVFAFLQLKALSM